jgi:hypothetical protein
MIDNSFVMKGFFNGTIEDLLRPFQGSNELERAKRLAPMYIKYCTKFGIRTDVAFAQMCHETGLLQFTGTVKADWNNFAGVGITGPTAVQTFKTEDLGVIAHVAHLAWYCFKDHVNSLCSRQFDPRHFESDGNHHPHYNGDVTLGHLNGNWAPSPTYTDKIIKFLKIINGEKEIVKPKPIQELKPEPEPTTVTSTVTENLDLILQMGHVGRTTGSTGTKGEQVFNKALGDEMDKLLKPTTIKYKIIGADNWLKPEPNKATIFLALHADGSTNPSARGFSMGFKLGTDESFKEVLAKDYGQLCKFTRRKDNYTTGLAKYYGYKHVEAKYCNIIEHGFLSNKIEHDWLVSHIKEIAQNHVLTIVKFIRELNK